MTLTSELLQNTLIKILLMVTYKHFITKSFLIISNAHAKFDLIQSSTFETTLKKPRSSYAAICIFKKN